MMDAEMIEQLQLVVLLLALGAGATLLDAVAKWRGWE